MGEPSSLAALAVRRADTRSRTWGSSSLFTSPPLMTSMATAASCTMRATAAL